MILRTVVTVGRMPIDPRTPVIVGVGQLTRRPSADTIEVVTEPVAMIGEAARLAAKDSGVTDPAKLLRSVASVRAVDVMSWRYTNTPAAICAAIDAEPRQRIRSTTGGNSPQMLLNDAASAILDGDVDSVLIGGAEAFASRRLARTLGAQLSWPTQGDESGPPERMGDNRPGSNDVEMSHSLALPTQVYPVFENALRAASGIPPTEHGDRVAAMWARFSEVAAGNPNAWSRDAVTASAIATPSADNRLIGFPYTKVQCANLQVDQAAAVLLCSVEAARSAGIPQDRWVFPWSGADAHDHWFVSERADLHSSPAIAACGAAALRLGGTTMDDVEHVELYSCFPSAVQIGAHALGIDPFGGTRSLTQTGGLAFFGGPGNNYSTHGIAAMVERLRRDRGIGLVTALGWFATKHSVGLYSAEPPSTAFRAAKPQEDVDRRPRVALVDEYEGPGTLESFTVMHERDGTPALAIVAVRTPSGARTWANSTEEAVMQWLTSAGAVVGTAVKVDATNGVTL